MASNVEPLNGRFHPKWLAVIQGIINQHQGVEHLATDGPQNPKHPEHFMHSARLAAGGLCLLHHVSFEMYCC